MENLKFNKVGRKKFVEMIESGCKIISENKIFYLIKNNEKVAILSEKFSNDLLEKNIITKE